MSLEEYTEIKESKGHHFYEFEEDLEYICSFLCKIVNILIDKGLFVSPMTCENIYVNSKMHELGNI